MQQAAFDIKYLQDKSSVFYRDHGKFPSTEQGLKIGVFCSNLQRIGKGGPSGF
ncbi:MAG: hypothetical protein ACKVE4_00645 [Dissulfuribacterales bacterium]